MQVFTTEIKIYADGQQEVEEFRACLMEFIKTHAEQGRAVTAGKLTAALKNWDKNIIVRNRIISYLNG